MTQILYGQPVVDKIYQETIDEIHTQGITGYLAIFMFGHNNPSAVYVRKKIAYVEKIGLSARLYTDIETVRDDIVTCNNDPACLGIIIQLPLPSELIDSKQALLNAVDPLKDIDCLGEGLLGMCSIGSGEIQVLPATPAAVLYLLDYYAPYSVQSGKDIFVDTAEIAVLGQSDLIGKPLAAMLRQRGSTVHVFDKESDQIAMRTTCKQCDIIIAATGHLLLVDETFIRNDSTQIIIDVGRGMHDGKAVGDVHVAVITPMVAAITPVPGGVGPVTVASLFWNLVKLWKAKNVF